MPQSGYRLNEDEYAINSPMNASVFGLSRFVPGQESKGSLFIFHTTINGRLTNQHLQLSFFCGRKASCHLPCSKKLYGGAGRRKWSFQVTVRHGPLPHCCAFVVDGRSFSSRGRRFAVCPPPVFVAPYIGLHSRRDRSIIGSWQLNLK